MRDTLETVLEAASPDRDPRITIGVGGIAFVQMDDYGAGEFCRVVSDSEAAELIARGLCRDAR